MNINLYETDIPDFFFFFLHTITFSEYQAERLSRNMNHNVGVGSHSLWDGCQIKIQGPAEVTPA